MKGGVGPFPSPSPLVGGLGWDRQGWGKGESLRLASSCTRPRSAPSSDGIRRDGLVLPSPNSLVPASAPPVAGSEEREAFPPSPLPPKTPRLVGETRPGWSWWGRGCFSLSPWLLSWYFFYFFFAEELSFIQEQTTLVCRPCGRSAFLLG